MTRALEVEGVGFEFPDGGTALQDVRFAIDVGECVGLVGPNGAGKSTLLLHLNGTLPHDGSRRSRGAIRVLGRRIEASTLPWVRRHLGLLFQDPDDQLFCRTVGDDVAFAPRQLAWSSEETGRAVREALATVGLSGFESREPHRLSMGEKKRACLAGLLAYRPSVLVLDEPTAGLDPRSRRQLLDVLARLPATKLVATHDLAMVAEVCPRSILLDRGVVVADRATSELFADDRTMQEHGLECPRRDLAPLLARDASTR